MLKVLKIFDASISGKILSRNSRLKYGPGLRHLLQALIKCLFAKNPPTNKEACMIDTEYKE